MLSYGWLLTGQTYSAGKAGEFPASTIPHHPSYLSIQNVSDNTFTEGLHVTSLEKQKRAWEQHWSMCQIWIRSSNFPSLYHCCVSVLLCFSVGKSHRGDAPDSLQQAPHVAVTASDEENVKCPWLSQVLWDWENCNLQWLWKPGLSDMQVITQKWQETSVPCRLGADAVVLAHWELKRRELGLN